MAAELQLRLEGVEPGEVQAFDAFAAVAVPVETVVDDKSVLGVG